MIGCVVVSDRGDLYLPETLENLSAKLPKGMPLHLIDDREHKLGLAGAARAAWRVAVDEGWDGLLHWEEDFRAVTPDFDRVLSNMEDALARFPFLSQVVLKRQAWSVEEQAAGGLVELHPDDYQERRYTGRYHYTIHRRIFSLNPCLIPRRVFELGWPDGNEAEMTETLNADPSNAFAIYGGKFDQPRIWHVGRIRGTGWKL